MHNGGHHQVNLYYLQLFESDANSVTDHCLITIRGFEIQYYCKDHSKIQK